jgi:L-ascorbate metabolism protein UlaG (beta-lactamase superfamily)
VALIPIGGTFTMDIDEAVEAAIAINAEIAIPMHHFKADPLEFKKQVEAKSNIQVAVLHIGEVFTLN